MSGESRCERASGVASLALRHYLWGSFYHDLSAGLTAIGSKVDNVVGCCDYVSVVFDDDHRISELNQTLQQLKQFLDVGSSSR